MSFLKKHWGTILSIAGTALYYAVPYIQLFISQHKNTAAAVILGALITLYNSTAPKNK